MVTRKDLLAEAEKKISELKAENEALEKEHFLFSEEDKAEDIRQTEERKLDIKKEELLNKQYAGNWENRDNWFYSKIPKFSFVKIGESGFVEDRNIIADCLTAKAEEKAEKIKNSEEFKILQKELRQIQNSNLSKRHTEIERDLQNNNRSLRWWNNRIAVINTRAGLIRLAKEDAQQKIRDEQVKIHEEKKEKYRKLIAEERK